MSSLWRLKVFRWAGWVVLLVATVAAALVARRGIHIGEQAVVLSEWRGAVVVLLAGVAGMMLCRLGASLLAARTLARARARQLAASEAWTRTVVETAAEGIITINERGNIESFNAAAERIFGYTADEVIGRSAGMLMPAPDCDHHDEYVRRHLQTGEAKGIGVARERQGRRKDGTVFALEVAVSELQLPDRCLFAGICQDITARKRAAQALLESRNFLQTVIDEIPDSVMVIDRDYRIVLANRAVRELVGGRDPVTGRLACYRASHHRQAPCRDNEHPCPLERVVATRRPVTVTHTHYDAQGNKLLMEIVAAPIFDQSGEVVQIVEACRDVTARVHAERQARQRQAEMAHMARLGTMGEMAAGLAHELNQPLSAIVNYTQACLERIRAGGHEPGVLLDDLEQAAAQAERAGDIIEHVRAFVRKDGARRGPAHLNSMVRGALELLDAELRRHHIKLQLTLADALPAVTVVPIQIEQVVVNLIQNALEAMIDTEDGERALTIRTESTEDHTVRFVIHDTGAGLPAGTLKRLFDPFFTTKAGGMGMGLAISRSIIEAHGGRLWSAANSDRGATFKFTLPVHSGADRDGA